VAGGAAGGLDPGTRATRTIKEYAPLFLRHHQVEGNTKDTYADTLRLHVIPFLGGCRLSETDRAVARNYITALQEEGRSANTIRQAKVVLGAMFGMAVADGYLDYNPFHDVKIPKVPGRRAIKIATPEQYLKVRGCLPTKPAQVFSTLLVSSGMRFCEAIGLQPADFDFEAGILEVARSVVKVSREHHPQGKTFLVRDYTKNGQTRRLKLDGAVVELVRAYVAEHGIGETQVMFPAELVVPPRRTRARLTEEEIKALGDCEPVGGRVYAHGTLGGYVQAKCRCAGCRQWARDYGRERMRVRRAVGAGDAGGGGIQDHGYRLGFRVLAGQGGDPGAVDFGPGLLGLSASLSGAVMQADEHGVGAVDLVASGGEVLPDRAEFSAAGDAVVHEPGGLGPVSVGARAGVDP
jgi:integrase